MKTMSSSAATNRTAFTLIELTVVIAMILLILTIALPSLTHLFRSGADAQSANIVTAFFSAARTLAIREAQYTCVHNQLAAPGTKAAGTGYLAICIRDPNTRLFRLATGFEPQILPGDMALGDVSATTVSGGNFIAAAADPSVLLCFSIVFSPSGKVVAQIQGENVKFDSTDPAFSTTDANTRIWDWNIAGGGTGEPGSSAVTLFQYGQYLARPASARPGYLDQNGKFLPVNVHTGQLYPRK